MSTSSWWSKARSTFPTTPGGPVRKSAEQVPLVLADTQTGEPGYSATLWETDFAFRKPRCDVVANGCAYAPGGRPAERVPVGIKVGNWSKLFEVVGHREWRAIGPLFTVDLAAALPQDCRSPTTIAWGGVDRLDPEDKLPGAYLHNPVGTGWAQHEEPAPHSRPAAAEHPGGRRGNPLALRRLQADELRADGPRLARPHRIWRHLRPELDRQHLPVPAAGFRRALFPDGAARPADRPAAAAARRCNWST